VANTALSVTKTWGDGEFWTEAIQDGVVTELEADSTQKTNNLDQMIADLFPGTYTLDGDGAANLVNALFNKQTAADTYATDIALGVAADAGFVDVDAVNAALVFTPELAGEYKLTFQFSEFVQSTVGTAIDVETYFQLTDGTVDSNPVETGIKMALMAADQTHLIQQVTVGHIFTLAAGAPVTISLQKYVITATNVGVHTLRGSADIYELYMTAEKL